MKIFILNIGECEIAECKDLFVFIFWERAVVVFEDVFLDRGIFLGFCDVDCCRIETDSFFIN